MIGNDAGECLQLDFYGLRTISEALSRAEEQLEAFLVYYDNIFEKNKHIFAQRKRQTYILIDSIMEQLMIRRVMSESLVKGRSASHIVAQHKRQAYVLIESIMTQLVIRRIMSGSLAECRSASVCEWVGWRVGSIVC